jgi:hypothetical protein
MTLPYDFWIGALGFNTFITKDQPYERATAQFRKDQFDSSSSVGDQSLAGWWTRGQFSFHKGAGLKYFEVAGGDTADSRFRDDLALDPFTEPGELSLATSIVSSYTSAAITSAVAAPANASGASLVLTSTGALRVITSAGSATSIGSGAYTGVTSDGTYWYASKGETIYSQGTNPNVVQTNYLDNPGPHSTTGWTLTGGGGFGSLNATTSGGTASGCAMGVNFSSTTTADWDLSYTVTGLTSGHDYELSMTVFAYGQELGDGHVPQIYADGTFGPVHSPGTFSSGGSSDRLTMTFRASGTSAVIGIVTPGGATISGGGAFAISDVMVTDAPSILTGYFDGNSPGWTWAGGAGASASSRSAGTSTQLIELWENGVHSDWAGFWWAKGRMWAVDNGGRFFSMAPAGGIALDNDTFWRSGILNSTGWHLSDSPGAVFIANGRDIYATTVVDEGLLPTIGAPAVVAQLPVGEYVRGIKFYLGQMVIATSAGIRLAQVGQDGLALAYGPLVVEGSAQVGRIAVRGNSAFVPLLIGSDLSLVELSFLDSVSDLVRPYSRRWKFAGAGASPSGVFLADDLTLRTYDETGLYKESTLATTGWLQTSNLRMGTLDPKAFRYLTVRTTGTTGSVAVSVITPNGTTTSVGTVNAGTSADLSLASALPTPVEYVALKFTFTGSGGAGPTLVGFQLKALPVPKRQRMIRVPLMLFDQERNRSGQQIVADPWDRLAALEALEESNAVVTFTDRETGETGSAYIEAIEVSRKAPAATGSGGFGGVIFVTLRRL